MAVISNTYFDHDNSILKQEAMKRLFLSPEKGDANRLTAFTDPNLLNIITERAIPLISQRYRSNGEILYKMRLLAIEISRYQTSGYKQAFMERLVRDTTAGIQDVAMDVAPGDNIELGDRLLDAFAPVPTDTGITVEEAAPGAVEQARRNIKDARSARFVNNPAGHRIADLFQALYEAWPVFTLDRAEVISLNLSTRELLQIDIDERDIQQDEFIPAGGSYSNVSASDIPADVRKAGLPSYTGVDITIVASMGPFLSSLDDIKTVTYSVHRDIANVFACGGSSRRGIVRGNRTVAGTIICTVRLDDPLLKMHPQWMTGESRRALENDRDFWRQTLMNDQLPMFDILITFQNELGYTSLLALYAIAISDVGQVMSIQDNEVEITFTYTATDVDIMRFVKYNRDGTTIQPYDTEAYKERRRKIIRGETVANNPYVNPELVDDMFRGGFNSLIL